MDHGGIYSNLAMLLSEQCVHTIKVAAFQGTDQSIFKDRREFTGSLMQQMNEVYDFIDFHNQTRATIKKLLRIDVRDFPETAVRESLMNLLVHRNYFFSASALISIYADRIEFVSVGGLLPGIDATKNAFKITLPNINAKYETDHIPEPKGVSSKAFSAANAGQASDNEHTILAFVRNHGEITRNDVENLLGVSTSTASRILRRMVLNNTLKQCGKARSTKYTLSE